MNIRELLIKVGFDGGNADRELNNIDKKTDKVKRGFEALNGVLATLFAAGSLRSLIQTAESMQNLDSRLQAVTGSAAEATAAMQQVHAAANETGIGFAEMGDTVARVIPAVKDFGMTADDSVKIATNLAAALKLNGATAAEAGAVVTQFSQALGSGVLQGDELRSIMEGAPNLYRDMAKAMNVTIGEFKQMSSKGKITSKWLADFMLKNDKYRKQLKEMPKSIGFAWNTIKNDVSAAIWSVNKQGGFLATIANRILKAWDKLKKGADDFVESLGGPDGLIQLMKDCGATAIWMAGAFAAIKIASMLTNPAGAATVAVTALGAAFLLLKNDFEVWQNGGQSAIDWGHWGDQIMRLADAFGLTGDNVKKTDDALNGLKSFSLADWSVKKEIESISRMFNQLSNTINDTAMTIKALSQGNFDAASYYADRTMKPEKYYDKNGLTLDPNGRGATVDYADQYYRNELNGKGNPVTPQSAPTTRQGWEGDYVPPQLPGVTNTTTTVNNSPTYNVTVNAQTNATAADIGAEVKRQVSAQMPRDRLADSLNKNSGAR
ncbi:hypothetical protein DVA43_02480 [Leclercia sp. W6]|uniref:tape measure protein n=1 Tax=Leclercia sp. W6 TaxID=2282310 RepID=UPI000DF3FF3C|nr:tape measure protein [Leclercia sp. W6]AXF58501.1 hypothetical protein DVA43_02480 [Leclercia sp. W6]